MNEKKYCERCGKIIGDAYNTDFFAYIRMKYCSDCREIVNKEQTAERVKRLRRRTREINKAKSDQLELLKEENEMLRLMIIKMREQLD
mgnify:CR=1 FL=1